MSKSMDPAYFVAWRKRQGLTQAQFAAKSGDHLVTVKRWETGARKLPPHIGWIMAAIEHGLTPVGEEAMTVVHIPNTPMSKLRRDHEKLAIRDAAIQKKLLDEELAKMEADGEDKDD